MKVILEKLINKFPDLCVCLTDIQKAYEILEGSFRRGGKLLICGNGGSAADSEHIVGELMKSFLLPRTIPETMRKRLTHIAPEHGTYLADHLQGALPAISLVSQTGLLTAYSNDVAADLVFAQQVYGYAAPDDVVLGISTSGNSKNVLYALEVGCALGANTIGLTGLNGGTLQGVCDVTICVPEDRTPEIQEKHIAIYHTICAMLEERFYSTEVH